MPEARAKGFEAQREALGPETTALVTVISELAKSANPFVPDILVNGSNGTSDPLSAGVMGLLREFQRQHSALRRRDCRCDLKSASASSSMAASTRIGLRRALIYPPSRRTGGTRMLRRTIVVGTALLLGSATGVRSQATSAGQSSDARVKSATSAAPSEISKNAMIMDWGEKPGAPMKELRSGSNGWVCHPSTPESFGSAAGEDPMCLDKQWQELVAAWVAKREPRLTGVGIAYMLQGDKGASNVDPYATEPHATNQWVKTGPHIMVVFPDPKQLEGLPTDPKGGGPFVMWKGTPYAHIMVPVR